MEVYLDNAATTPIDPEVADAMHQAMLENYGNPSSIHGFGRKAKSAIEKARKRIAELLNVVPSEIFFTSGGTESDNTALLGSIAVHEITHVVTSYMEHHAVLHPLEHMARAGKISLSYVNNDDQGVIDMLHLKELLKANPSSLVSIMHGNNELGNLNDIRAIAETCKAHSAIFHCDTVQTIAHYPFDLQEIPVHSIAVSAHKFHGPKGTGFLYLKGGHFVEPLIHGGAQERNMRGGTENLYGIVGMTKALEKALASREANEKHIRSLKTRLTDQLKANIPGVAFNGTSADLNQSMPHVVNVSIPPSSKHEMLLFNLDINKISVSSGSACTSGSQVDSHVLQAIGADPERAAIRVSFSKYNTTQEVDYFVDKLTRVYQ